MYYIAVAIIVLGVAFATYRVKGRLLASFRDMDLIFQSAPDYMEDYLENNKVNFSAKAFHVFDTIEGRIASKYPHRPANFIIYLSPENVEEGELIIYHLRRLLKLRGWGVSCN